MTIDNFPGPIHIFNGICAKFQDNSRTIDPFFVFNEFSRNNVKFKDFLKSVRTLFFNLILPPSM